MRELRAEQRLAAHERDDAAAVVVQPIDGAAGHIFRHSFHFVVEGPAIPAIDIAFVFEEKIRRDGMEIARQHARANVGEKPAAHLAVDFFAAPMASLRRSIRSGIAKLFRVLREEGFGKLHALAEGRSGSPGIGVHQEIVNGNIDSELSGSGHCLAPLS